MTARLGLSLGSLRLPLEAQTELAIWAEQAGAHSYWISEVRSQDALVHAAVIAACTDHLRLGTAVVSAFSRAPGLLAMATATLQQLSGGRFTLGLGASSRQVTADWMGVPFEQPLARLTDTVRVLRGALSGEPLSYDGDTTSLRDFRLGLPAKATELLLGATGQKAARLAGQEFDGIVSSTFIGATAFADWCAPVLREQGDARVVAKTFICLSDTQSSSMRRFLGNYLGVDAYNRALERQGFTVEAAALAEAVRGRDRNALAVGVSDRVLGALVCGPDVASIRDRADQLMRAGATDVVFEPIGDLGCSAATADAVRTTLAPMFAEGLR